MAYIKTAHGRTLREQHRKMTMDAIDAIMTGIAANPIMLIEVVARGPLEFRDRFLRECRGLAVTGDVADRVFLFFSQRLIDRFGPDADAKTLLDSPEIAALADQRPPTEAEIEASWEFGESHSSAEGKRDFYKDVTGPTIHVQPEPVAKIAKH